MQARLIGYSSENVPDGVSIRHFHVGVIEFYKPVTSETLSLEAATTIAGALKDGPLIAYADRSAMRKRGIEALTGIKFGSRAQHYQRYT